MSDDFVKIGHTEPAPTEGMVTRTIRQQAERIKKLEAALRYYAKEYENPFGGDDSLIARKALEEK